MSINVKLLDVNGCTIVHDKEAGLLTIIYEEDVSEEGLAYLNEKVTEHVVARGGVEHLPVEGEWL